MREDILMLQQNDLSSYRELKSLRRKASEFQQTSTNLIKIERQITDLVIISDLVPDEAQRLVRDEEKA